MGFVRLSMTCSSATRAFLVVVMHSVIKGATRPLNYVGENYEQVLNPSSHSLLAQRMGEERHSLKRREGLFRASDS